jgi:hypothetical protein
MHTQVDLVREETRVQVMLTGFKDAHLVAGLLRPPGLTGRQADKHP